MSRYRGRYEKQTSTEKKGLPYVLIPLSFLLIELFGLCFLLPEGEKGTFPLAFGVLWSGAISGTLFLFPALAARILYGIMYFLSAVYAGFQTGYYLLFSEMLWLSDFRYASEGADYADVLLTYPVFWWLGILGMILQGVLILWKFPRWKRKGTKLAVSVLVIAASASVWMRFRSCFTQMMTKSSMPVLITDVPSLPRRFMRICSIPTGFTACVVCTIPWPRIFIRIPSIP